MACVSQPVKTLADKEVVFATKQFDFNGGCVATNYQLKFRGREAKMEEPYRTGPLVKKWDRGGVSNYYQGVSQKLTRPLVKKRDTQYTVNNKQLDNNANVSKKAKKRSSLHDLHDLNQPKELSGLIGSDILSALGDQHSKAFYLLVARKVPEGVIRRTLSELRQGNSDSAAKVFTTTMLRYAEEKLSSEQSAALAASRTALTDRFSGR